MNGHKAQIVEQAIVGLRGGGFTNPEIFTTLLTRVYECGYNEAQRELQELNRTHYDWITGGHRSHTEWKD